MILLLSGDRLTEIRHHRPQALLSSSGAASPSRLALCSAWKPAQGSLDWLVGSAARPFPQRLEKPPFSLLVLIATDSTVGSTAPSANDPLQRAENLVLKARPVANHVPLEIRVGLVSQRPVTAFWPGRKVLCRNEQGFVIPYSAAGHQDRFIQPSGDSLLRRACSDQPADVSGGCIAAQKPA